MTKAWAVAVYERIVKRHTRGSGHEPQPDDDVLVRQAASRDLAIKPLAQQLKLALETRTLYGLRH